MVKQQDKLPTVEPVPGDPRDWLPETDSRTNNDQQVIIELSNGSRIEFIAYWNNGLGIFVSDYEWFLRGRDQSKERYQMQTKNRDQNNLININFENIVAIHLNKKL